MTEFFFLSRPKPVQNGPAPQHWPSAVPDACRGRIGQTERQEEEEESCCAYHVVLGTRKYGAVAASGVDPNTLNSDPDHRVVQIILKTTVKIFLK